MSSENRRVSRLCRRLKKFAMRLSCTELLGEKHLQRKGGRHPTACPGQTARTNTIRG